MRRIITDINRRGLFELKLSRIAVRLFYLSIGIVIGGIIEQTLVFGLVLSLSLGTACVLSIAMWKYSFTTDDLKERNKK